MNAEAMIVRHVRVNRSCTPAEVIEATGRNKWYIDQEVLAEMPRVGFEEGKVEIFELDYSPTPDELDREYESRGLKPDPYAAAQVVIDDPAFTDKHERPLAVQWRDSRGRVCSAVFYFNGIRRRVGVGWGCEWWPWYYRFAGVRQK